MHDTAPDHTLATMLSTQAHDLRNHVSTLRSAALLLDDDIAADVTVAARALQIAVERAVTLARIDLDGAGEPGIVRAGDLVALASRRAAREGAGPVAYEPTGPIDDVQLLVSARIAERLVTDLCHVAAHPASLRAATSDARLELTTLLDDALDDATTGLLLRLGSACAASIRITGASIVVGMRIAPAGDDARR